MLGELFDPSSEWSIKETCKPHWSQAGAVVFITFRLHDSIPAEVIQRWDDERVDWLRRKGLLSATVCDWKSALNELPDQDRAAFASRFRKQQERYLDGCRGQCILRNPKHSQIISDSLHHFDGQRYTLGDFVVMPNHVHLLAAFPHQEQMIKQCYSWMHFTARVLNQTRGRSGSVWQTDAFDHLVRSPEQYEYLRTYIEGNPRMANLAVGDYLYWRSPRS